MAKKKQFVLVPVCAYGEIHECRLHADSALKLENACCYAAEHHKAAGRDKQANEFWQIALSIRKALDEINYYDDVFQGKR